MLVSLVRSLGQDFQPRSLSILQEHSLVFRALLVGTRAYTILVFEEAWRKEKQLLGSGGGGEIHTVHVVGVGVQLAVQGLCNAHLVLQNRVPLLAQEDSMTALAGTSLQHQKSQLLSERRGFSFLRVLG